MSHFISLLQDASICDLHVMGLADGPLLSLRQFVPRDSQRAEKYGQENE